MGSIPLRHTRFKGQRYIGGEELLLHDTVVMEEDVTPDKYEEFHSD